MKIQLASPPKTEDPALRQDLVKIQNAINKNAEILEVDAYATDPTGFDTTTGKVFVWYNTTTDELKIHINGTTRKIATTV